jgi:hypothetical protein
MVEPRDTDAAKVRTAYERSGALAAAAEMNRLFPGLSATGAQAAARMKTAACPAGRAAPMFGSMFAMDEADATAISAAFDNGGEQAAAVEL